MPTPDELKIIAKRELARRELSRRSEASGKNDFGMAGPLALSGSYLRKGLSIKDAPYVASKAGSEFLGGLPQMAAEKPIQYAMAGPFGATSGKPEQRQFFPKPYSEGGKMMGRDLGLATGVIDPGLAASNVRGLIKKPVQRFGVRVMQGILSPKGGLADKSAEIAERALWEGLVGTKEGMLEKVYESLKEGGIKIGDIIKGAKGKPINLDTVFSGLRDLKREYEFAQDAKKAAVIEDLIKQFKPAFKEEKTIKAYKRLTGVEDEFGEITPVSKFVKQKRTVNRPVPVEEAQARKVAQYKNLSEGKSFPLESSSAEVRGRKAYARGFMKATEDIVPEIQIHNRRFGGLSEVAQALEERLPVEQRRQLFGLGDIILGASGAVSPKALTTGVLRKGFQWTPITSRVARGAYRFGRRPADVSLAYPLARYFGEQSE